MNGTQKHCVLDAMFLAKSFSAIRAYLLLLLLLFEVLDLLLLLTDFTLSFLEGDLETFLFLLAIVFN